jgi:hypothetical protein
MKTYDTVYSRVEIKEIGVAIGTKGVVVDIYETPYPAYEIEFLDEAEKTLGFASLMPSEVYVDGQQDRLAA